MSGRDVMSSCSFPAATSVPPTVSAPKNTSKPRAAAVACPTPSMLCESVWYSPMPTSVAASALNDSAMAMRCGIAVIGTHIPSG